MVLAGWNLVHLMAEVIGLDVDISELFVKQDDFFLESIHMIVIMLSHQHILLFHNDPVQNNLTV